MIRGSFASGVRQLEDQSPKPEAPHAFEGEGTRRVGGSRRGRRGGGERRNEEKRRGKERGGEGGRGRGEGKGRGMRMRNLRVQDMATLRKRKNRKKEPKRRRVRSDSVCVYSWVIIGENDFLLAPAVCRGGDVVSIMCLCANMK